MSNLIPLEFEGQSVRVVTSESGEPLFVGKDVCDVLGYSNYRDAIARHCKGVAKHDTLDTEGGPQPMRVLKQSDVLRLIVSSHLPAAQRFEGWVFDEVLPSILTTGSYVHPNATPPDSDRIMKETITALKLLDFDITVVDPETGQNSTITLKNVVNTLLNHSRMFKRDAEMIQALIEQQESQRDYVNNMREVINAQAEMLQFAYQQMFSTKDYREALAQPRFHTHQQLLSELLGRVSRLEDGCKKTNKRVAKLERDPAAEV